jgi:exodeoxyribonuclease-3
MLITTWNINGYRSIAGQNPSKRYDTVTKENKLFAYIESEKPDILCMQETKASLDQIDEALRTPEGYFSFYNDCKVKKGYSGVAMFSKIEPKSVKYGIGIPRFDDEGRILEADFGDFTLFNIYFPKGYADDAERLGFKLEFYDALFEYIDKLREKQPYIIVAGDYNTAHKEIDLARPKENTGTSGFLPVEREKLDQLVKNGYVDALRQVSDKGEIYSWWSQRGQARRNNIGWRIDYHFVTKEMAKSIKSVEYQMQQQGSDHCPVAMELI